MTDCLNCQNPLQSTDSYCASCGQPTFNLHQSFNKVIGQMLHELLDIDGRLARTLKGLLFKPGLVSSEYRQGKRISYTPPLRMYLVTSVLLFFVTSLFQNYTSSHPSQSASLLLPPELLEQIPKLMFMLLPVYAAIMHLWQRLFNYQKTPANNHYIFNIVFAVHIHIFSYIVIMLLLPLKLLPQDSVVYLIINTLLILFLLIYPTLAIKRFYQQSWLKSLLMGITTFFIYINCIGLGFKATLTFLEVLK